ncbi:hypothetical protein ACXYMO_16510 [Arenibacterium sp. CAU 1754]
MSDPLAPLITALHGQGRLRVWSLVITVFGDLIQHRGGRVSTARLGQLLGRVGVEQGTLRTALSRLGRDGWVTSERQGRTSLYRLSKQGIERFAPATTLIYAPPRTAPVTEWAMSVHLGANGAQTVDLRPAGDTAQVSDACVTGTLSTLSDAFRDAQFAPAHRDALSALRDDLAILNGLNLDADMPPLDIAAARLLLIHRWRRIVLRFPDVLPDLMPATSPLTNPRLAVARCYARLIDGTEAWLDSDAGDLGALPRNDAVIARRFAPDHQT